MASIFPLKNNKMIFYRMEPFQRILLLGWILIISCFAPTIAQSNAATSSDQNNGYCIKVVYPGHAGSRIILGHYYDYMVMGDTEMVLDEQSTCEFIGSTPLKGGLYTFIVNGQTVAGDFVVDKDQDFVIYLNDQPINGSSFQTFEGSPENNQLLAYQSYMAEQGAQINEYHHLMSHASDPDESLRYTKALAEIDDQIRNYRDQVVAENPKSTLGMMLSVLPEPKLPVDLRNPTNRKDSLAAREYMSEHFWDKTKFWDGRLANTPFLSDKLDKYFAEVLIPKEKIVIHKIDQILSSAVADSMLYRLILRKVIMGSKDHYFKWDDAVFIHLYEKYLADEPADWLVPKERAEIDQHAFFLMGNTTGAPAPEITLPGFDEKLITLKDLETTYTIVAFWDPTCGHCKVVLPKLDSLVQHHWKKQGVEAFAVGVESDATEVEWRSFITENKLNTITHVYNSRESMMAAAQASQPLVTKSFDVWYFPAFFLLDKDKKFMARKLSFEKMSELVNSILKE